MRLVSVLYDCFHPFHILNGIKDLIVSIDPQDLRKGDILLLHGGEDISPSIYGKEVSIYTGAGPKLSRRDQIETNMAQEAINLGIPIIGICRGAQLLCAIAGGHLIQHVNHHGRDHQVESFDGKKMAVNSCHHQMMFPWTVPHEMVLSLKPPISDVHFDVNNDVVITEEPEGVYFNEIKGFAWQFHPEWMDTMRPVNQYIMSYTNQKLTELSYG